jgi:protein O-mannosyl-transferase
MIDSKANRQGGLVSLMSLILALGTLACYWPVLHAKFVNVDDPIYVYEAPMVKRGLSWAGLAWAFKSMDGGNWNPMVWISHMADWQLFNENPGGHHLTNLVLHIANTVMLFLVLRFMTGATWRSGLVAALFAWHPLHVESVAWISERKDVLSVFFFLPSLWSYTHYVRAIARTQKFYFALTFLFFSLSLMCKPMLVTFPLILLLMDYWPLQRTDAPLDLVKEKIPFAVVSLAASILAVFAQQGTNSVGAESMTLWWQNAAVSYVTYLTKLFWPVHLGFFYPLPHSISMARTFASILLLVLISFIVARTMKHRRYLGVGWFWFLATLLPVIGIIHVGMQAWADRYTYLPYIGLGIMLSWGLGEVAQLWPNVRIPLVGATSLGLVACMGATLDQVKYWHDSKALTERALRVTTGNYFAHNNLGNVLLDEDKPAEAAREFQQSTALEPNDPGVFNNLGQAYAMQGKLDEAITMFYAALRLNPNHAHAHHNLGNVLLQQGKPTEAIPEFKAALRANPENPDARKKLADALLTTGRGAEAVAVCEQMVADDPHDAYAHFARGWAYQTQKQPERALRDYQEAVRLSPKTPACLNALAWMYATCPQSPLRNGPEAVRLASQACDLTKRQNLQMLDTLGAALAETGRFEDAIKVTEEIRARAQANHDTNTQSMEEQRLKLYTAGRPYRDEP